MGLAAGEAPSAGPWAEASVEIESAASSAMIPRPQTAPAGALPWRDSVVLAVEIICFL
jgi:hypothetical protein